MWSGAEGASAERTRLAWLRTGLSSTAVVLLTVRLATRDRFTALGVSVAVAALLAWLAQMWLTKRRIEVMEQQEPAGIGWTLPATALAAVVFALLGVVLVLTRH